MFAFTSFEAEWAILISSMLISLAGTAMYAVLCEWNIFAGEHCMERAKVDRWGCFA